MLFQAEGGWEGREACKGRMELANTKTVNESLPGHPAAQGESEPSTELM